MVSFTLVLLGVLYIETREKYSGEGLHWSSKTKLFLDLSHHSRLAFLTIPPYEIGAYPQKYMRGRNSFMRSAT
jgi:hypothetical protein